LPALTPDQPLALEKLNRLRTDYLYYAPRCLKIRTKSGKLEWLTPNRAQIYCHERLEAQRARLGLVRAIVVKGRQQGLSTYIGGRFYHRASLNRGIEVFILTHEQKATDNLFGMVERFHAHSPLRPSTGAANAKELKFDKLDSGYAVGTAGTKAGGRSRTIQLFHGSEAAFWANAAQHFAGVVQAIPFLPGTEIILESTGNGVTGEFVARCRQAMAGIGDYILIFIPWYWDDGYRRPLPAGFELDEEERGYFALHQADGLTLEHMVWRRAKMLELKDPLLFRQEYPATVEEAFQATGHDSFIKSEDVLRARKATLQGVGPLILGVDPKREGSDRFGIAWRKGRKVLKVEGDNAPIDNVRAAAMLKDIIDRDKPAAVFIDAGGGGGIFDILVAWGAPYSKICKLVNFGGKPIHPPKRDRDGKPMAGPKNRRAEMWSLSNDWLQDEGGADLPDDDAIQADACAPGFYYDPVTQQLILQSKDELEVSPDLWDAIALTFAEPVIEASTRKPLAQPNLGIV
jgi:hypothetical protein